MANSTRRQDLSRQLDSSIYDVDLASFLSSKAEKKDAIFLQALQLLDSLKASPSCNRLAATRLLTSCQAIGDRAEGVSPDAYVALDRIKSLYAARLAICELDGAGASVPASCIPLTEPTRRKGLLSFISKAPTQAGLNDSVPKELLEPCLKSLETRPQWWTSYSNSRQNAVVICQAARVETERDELLELHKSVVDSTVHLNDGLQNALRRAAEGSLHQKAFLEEVDAMRARVTSELEANELHLRSMLANALQGVESVIDAVVIGVGSILRRVDGQAQSLEHVCALTSETITVADDCRTY